MSQDVIIALGAAVAISGLLVAISWFGTRNGLDRFAAFIVVFAMLFSLTNYALSVFFPLEKPQCEELEDRVL